MTTTTSSLLAFCALLLAVAATHAAAPDKPMTEREILDGADARIQKYRTAEIQIKLTRDGKPLSGAKVEVQQTRHEFLFGANIFGYWEVQEPARSVYLQRFQELLNFATLPFYWSSYETAPGKTRAAEMRECAQWCLARGITPKAHPMIFNTSAGVPKWLPKDPDEAFKATMSHVTQTVGDFPGTIDFFDVVNEAVAITRYANPMTDAWKKTGQVEFARQAFMAARKANPKSTLLINDYELTKSYETLIEGLVDDKGKALYDAIGIQSHMHAGVWPVEWQWRCCEIYARFGVPLHFTEISILSGPITGPKSDAGRGETTPEGEIEQAKHAEQLYTVLFSHPAVQAITWWAFTEKRPWDFPPTALLRKDMTPKPSYERLKALIKGKWWTKAAGMTAEDGTFSCRAFFGDHEVRVTMPDGSVQSKPIVVGRKDAKRVFDIGL